MGAQPAAEEHRSQAGSSTPCHEDSLTGRRHLPQFSVTCTGLGFTPFAFVSQLTPGSRIRRCRGLCSHSKLHTWGVNTHQKHTDASAERQEHRLVSQLCDSHGLLPSEITQVEAVTSNSLPQYPQGSASARSSSIQTHK